MQMLNFRQYFEQTGKRRLCIFDFDNTLVKTPEREEGSKRWRDATGQEWLHKGWWGRKETLRPPIFNSGPNDIKHNVVEDFKKAKADPQAIVVMMTGRHGGLEQDVKGILSRYGLEPDEEYYKGHRNLTKDPRYPKNDDTWAYKHHVLINLLAPREGIEEIEIWDDRAEHVPMWLEAGKWIKDNYSTIQRVIFHDAETGEDYNL